MTDPHVTDNPTLKEAKESVEATFSFTGSIPGEDVFQIKARDLFLQQLQIEVPANVTSSTDNFGPFAFEFDQAHGNQNLHILEDVAPGDTVVVEILSSVTVAGNFTGDLVYDPIQTEPLLDAFLYGEQAGGGGVVGTSDPTVEPWWDGVRKKIRLSADVTDETTPIRVLTASFIVQPGFSSPARIRLDRPFLGDSVTNYVVPALEVELRAAALPMLNGDFDGDGSVGFSDFLSFAGAFGKSAPAGSAEAAFDLDSSGDIGFGDFLAFAAAFGSTI